jgi:hypothetical protein
MSDASVSHARLLWALIVIPITAWMVHLTFSAAFVPFTADHPEYRWTLYAITAVTGLVVVVTTVVSVRLVRANPDGRIDGDTDTDQVALLAVLAVVIGVINFVLIVAEGSVVPFLSSHA